MLVPPLFAAAPQCANFHLAAVSTARLTVRLHLWLTQSIKQ